MPKPRAKVSFVGLHESESQRGRLAHALGAKTICGKVAGHSGCSIEARLLLFGGRCPGCVPPAGYVVDRTRIKLGEGAGTLAAAKAALRRWEHFRLGWVETWPPETPIQAGQVVAVIARLFGLW